MDDIEELTSDLEEIEDGAGEALPPAQLAELLVRRGWGRRHRSDKGVEELIARFEARTAMTGDRDLADAVAFIKGLALDLEEARHHLSEYRARHGRLASDF